jgi:energy-coupling factor transporter ATP-binding protein EcfA2
MLTKLIIRNFKRLASVEVELGQNVVLIGPNNSGKTSALQALTLWDVGLRQWLSKRSDKARREKRPGVAINRRDLLAIPVPSANLLWRDLHVRDVTTENGKQRTRNIRIDVNVEGIHDGKAWTCGLEFDYSNDESLFCRPIRESGHENSPVGEAHFTTIPEAAVAMRVAYLPPMSGLTDREFLKQPGEIGFLIGQGQTAQVLRNLCYQVFQDDATLWQQITDEVKALFGVQMLEPQFRPELAEISLAYRDVSGSELDLSSTGRGLQQTLLLLSYLYANPKTTLLLDEPDAHLEILRQREIFRLLSRTAEKFGSQIIAASHSEVVLNEAATSGKVVAFVGKPHVLSDRPTQVIKALTDIGWEQYYQAERRGWVLYVENATDLAILQAFAELLGHPAQAVLSGPFVHYVATNLPQRARDHFYGLREAKPNLVGLLLFDRIDKSLAGTTGSLHEIMWIRREIENYFCTEEVLLAYARGDKQADDLFAIAESHQREQAMRESIAEVSGALQTLGKGLAWSDDVKASDDFLDPVFRRFFEKLRLPLAFRKSDYYQLVRLLPPDQVPAEVIEKLELIHAVAKRAQPEK